MDDIETLKRILRETKTIAMVGLSAEWMRPSNFAAKYLKEHGYRIIPVNPRYKEILGERCYPSLLEIPEKVDVVDIFRRQEDVPPIVEDAIRIGAKVVWMQLGIVNEEAAKRAREAGLEVVMNRCMKIEHARLLAESLKLMGITTGVISSKKIR
ncbi:MAG: CoA-binding protein [Candidatus Methanosuratincola sp.]|jgi:predicted CoA-binding protein